MGKPSSNDRTSQSTNRDQSASRPARDLSADTIHPLAGKDGDRNAPEKPATSPRRPRKRAEAGSVEEKSPRQRKARDSSPTPTPSTRQRRKSSDAGKASRTAPPAPAKSRKAPAQNAKSPHPSVVYWRGVARKFFSGLARGTFLLFSKICSIVPVKWPWFIKYPLRAALSVAFVGLVVGSILVAIYATLSSRYDISNVVSMPARTLVLDSKNREIGRLHGENRDMVKLEEIPQVLRDAVIVREDKRFYEHSGVDWIGVGRAVAQVAKHNRATQGASTLTMQLAKNTFHNNSPRSLHQKLLEIAISKRLEATYSKDQLLEAYLNRIFWGHGMLGISSAAREYFGKLPRDLSLAESALLAGIIRGPSDHSPRVHPESAKRERDVTLGQMLAAGKITREQHDAAIAEPVKVLAAARPIAEDNYAMDIVRRELRQILEEENIQEGGLTVRTTLDLDLQQAAIDALDRQLTQLESRKGWKHQTRRQYQALPQSARETTPPQYLQGSVVVLDHTTGGLVVLVGGRDARESKFNRAVQARRQIGSLFKPFIYAAFFRKGYTPSSTLSDNRIPRGELWKNISWSPRNSDGQYLGPQPAGVGLIRSRNTMSVRAGFIAGLDNVIRLGHLAGFEGNIPNQPSSLLGSWEASPAEVASAFGIFGNGGVRATPYVIEEITDSTGHVIYTSPRRSYPVLSPNETRQVSQLLEQITKPGGTAYQTAKLGFTAPCGGKTGTTNKYTNAWFAGFSSSLTCAVWIGLDNNSPIMEKGYGGTLALPVWVDVMKSASANNYPAEAISYSPRHKNFAALLCRDSGEIAHSGCIYHRTAYPAKLTAGEIPATTCHTHPPRAIPVDESDTSTSRPPRAIPVESEDFGVDEPTEGPPPPRAIPIDEP